MKTTTLDHVTRARQSHHAALASLSTDPKADGFKLWRKLRKLEMRTHSHATDYCNGDCTGEEWDRAKAFAAQEVLTILGKLPDGFFSNGDARGYTLKIDPDNGVVPQGMHTDWGRNGILAPVID